MKKINQNYNKIGGNVNTEGKQVNIAHFSAKGLLQLWLISFLFLLFIIIVGFAVVEYQIGQLA